jgi:hypothetical protein
MMYVGRPMKMMVIVGIWFTEDIEDINVDASLEIENSRRVPIRIMLFQFQKADSGSQRNS